MPDLIRVLHVDDDPEFADLTARYLQRESERLTVDTALSADGAQTALGTGDVDCIVSDYEMPERDGIAFLESVRESNADLPFILFTGRGSEEVASAALSAGATDYLQKETGTSQYTVLANRIENAVAQYRAEQRSERENRRREQMLGRITDCYVSLDEELRFTYLNEPAVAFIQRPAEALIGTPYHEVQVPDSNDNCLQAFEEALETQETRTVTGPSDIQPDRRIETRVFPSETGLSVYFRDITELTKKQQELEQSRKRLKTQFEQAPHGIIIHDADGNIIEANERLATVLGYDVAELESMHILDLEQEYSREDLAAILGSIDDDSRFKGEGTHRRADGSTVPVEVWTSRLDFGDETRFLAHVRDISEQRQRAEALRDERERFSSLFEEFPEATIAYEYAGEEPLIREVNEAFEETFGYDEQTAVGSKASELVVPERQMAAVKEIDRRAMAGERFDREVLRRTADGERLFNLRNIPVTLEADIDGYAVYNDIHEQKQREQDIERKNERLNRLVDIVSHDLRNPLNVASSRLSLARDDCDCDHLAYVERAHDRIGGIIDDTLTLARQGDTVEEMTAVDLQTVTRRWWAGVGSSEATLDVTTDRSIRADTDHLQHVFENLFRNAVEHGGTAVTVTVGALDGEAGFFVADDGPGVPPEAGDVFEPGVTMESDGIGFGLAIVRETVEAHGWEIQVVESAAGGARFEISGVDLAG